VLLALNPFFTAVAFDVHLAETFVPLALGMPLYSAPRSQLLENLPFFVGQLGITHLGIVPSLIEATMGAVQEGGNDRMALRYIASGGEKMSDSVRRSTVYLRICFPNQTTLDFGQVGQSSTSSLGQFLWP
jgi:hypothetical protein